jgi:hypothetical protein
MLSENYILDALQAEKEGTEFPIDFDVVWENYGFKHHYHARRFLRGILETLTANGLSRSGCANNQSVKVDKYYLSVKGLKFSLARAKTEKGAEYLLYLLDVEEKFLQQLERQLSLTALDTPGYPHTADELWKDSGIVNRYQVRDAIKRDFTEGRHWYCENGQIHISEICYKILLLNFRSKRGSSISKLGDRLNIPVAELYEYEQRKRSNTRNPQKYSDPMQMSLFG